MGTRHLPSFRVFCARLTVAALSAALTGSDAWAQVVFERPISAVAPMPGAIEPAGAAPTAPSLFTSGPLALSPTRPLAVSPEAAISTPAPLPAAAAAEPAPAPLAALTAAAVPSNSRGEESASGASLHGLTDALALGRNDDDSGKTEEAIARTFDNQSGRKKDEGIPLDWVDGMIAKSASADPQSRRLHDIVERVGFSKAALNREILQAHNTNYTIEIPMGSITNQLQSGRCWLFAGLNMIAATMVADNKVPKDFEFSENYLHFFNMLEKSNRHLEDVSRSVYRRSSRKDFSAAERRAAVTPQLGDGGWYEYFAFLVSKYGLAPKSAMGETISSEATAVMLSELKDSLAATSSEMLANAKQYKAGRQKNRAQEIRNRGMSRIWKILTTHLGTPPAQFDYRAAGKTETAGRLQVTPVNVKTYTPREFAREFVKFDARDYISVSSYPGKNENTVYEAKNSAIGRSPAGEPDFNIRFLNVSSDRLEQLAADSIRGGEPVWFAADIGNSSDNETGILHPRLYDRAPIYQFTPEEAAPVLTRKQAAYFGRINATHAMVLTGLDQPDPSKPVVKYKDENSWGDKVGTKGIYHLYPEWFHQNVFEIVVHRRFLNDEETQLWHGKATNLKKDDSWY
jgi:bleomycin hydrolase